MCKHQLVNIGNTIALVLSLMAVSAQATELEVSHWWTSGGESAAVQVLADEFEAGGDTWIDNAVAGGGGDARAVIVSRILGGDPMGAMQFNHGRQVEELVEEGLIQDLTELAEKENWRDFIRPAAILNSCTVDGRIYCAPINIHSWQWMWLNVSVYKEAGLAVPTNWTEFVDSAPTLLANDVIPLAIGNQAWQILGVFNVLMASVGGKDLWNRTYELRDEPTWSSEQITGIWQAFDQARRLSDPNNVQTNWSDATHQVIRGEAAAHIIGDWAQGEFIYAGKVPGIDYECLPGLGMSDLLDTAGDAFYFPRLDDPDKTEAQFRLASTIVSPPVQLGFNRAKGSLPLRDDIDMSDASACMQKGLEILKSGENVIRSYAQLISNDTEGELNDLAVEFWSDTRIDVAEAQARFVKILQAAEN